MTVLLLNASYEPLTVLPVKRAVSLWLRGRVDPATQEHVVIHSAERGLKMPTVLRLRRYVNVPRRKARWSRMGVLHRDKFRCIYCGIQPGGRQRGRMLTSREFTIDHLIPRSRGGRNTWGNTACACPQCNGRKRDRTPHEAGMKLLWEPKTPRVDYLVAQGDVPEAWKVYLEIGG